MSKRAMVTGASEGIGHEIAKQLAKAGYSVTGVARNEAKLKDLMKDLGPGHDYLVADLATDAGQDKAAKALGESHYEVLVNNAGVGVLGVFAESSVERQAAMVSLNCMAVVKLSHAFLKGAKKGDALVNVSSTLSFAPMPGMGLYCATKSFVTALTECLWFENQARGVYVFGLHPGITTTNFQVNAGGRTEDLPKGLAQTVSEVADVTMAALRSRSQPTVISGSKNKMFAGMFRLMSRKAMIKMTGGMIKQSMK